MKKKPIDLQAIREARANLDKLAREHPELLGPSSADDWEDILKGQSTSERQRNLIAKRRAEGLARVTVWLSETTREALREHYPGPRGGIDWEAVTAAALEATQPEARP
jgi:hypothetical protein